MAESAAVKVSGGFFNYHIALNAILKKNPAEAGLFY